MIRLVLYLLPFIIAPASAIGQTFVGTFAASDVGLQVTLQQIGGHIEGELVGGGAAAQVQGRAEGKDLTGTVSDGRQVVPFQAQLCPAGDHLSLRLPIGGQWQTFTLERTAAPQGGNQAALPGQATEKAVIVNGEHVPSDVVRGLESRYQVRIQGGTYWYDRESGAWGLQGGPTAGFIVAGLRIGGGLQADASGGGTRVHVNGRALHPQDLAALQHLVGPLQPGRYWLDAQGNAGPEGGPAAVNLVQLAQRRQGGSQYRSGITDIGVGSSSDGFYIMGEDWSYSSF